MSTAPTPLRATTVAGAILAVIFIALSAIVGGINVWRTHAAETFTSQAEQAQSDKASIDQAIKDAKTRLDSVNVDASAAAWCDSVTRSNASSMRGPLNVTVIGYTTEKNKSFNPTSPYQGTTTATLTPGTPLTFSVTVPYDPNMTGNTECGATMTAWWPSDM